MENKEKKTGFLTKAFNKAAGVTYVGPNATLEQLPLDPGLSQEDLHRAMDPPPLGPKDTQGFVAHDYFINNYFGALQKDTPATQAWVAREEQKFQDYIADAAASSKKARAFIDETLDIDADEAQKPVKVGKKFFRSNIEADRMNPPLEAADGEDGPWKTVIDPKKLTPDGSLFPGKMTISDDGARVLVFLSPFGRDNGILCAFDTETGAILPGQDAFPTAPTSMSWDKDSHDSFTYTDPAGLLLRHVIGNEDSEVVFRPEPRTYAVPYKQGPANYEWINTGFGTDNTYGLCFRPWGSKEPFTELMKPQQYTLNPLLEKEDGSIIAFTTKDAPRGKIISFRPDDPSPDKWKTIVPQPESKMDAIRFPIFSKDKMIVLGTHDMGSELKVYTLDGKHLYDAPMEFQSRAAYIAGMGNDTTYLREDGRFKLAIESFRHPSEMYIYDVDANALTPEKEDSGKPYLKDCIVERLYATSKDGTVVPMTAVYAPGTKLDGTAATKLYGYGAFGTRLTPQCTPETEQFVRAGGIYVQANIRGGGEFGREWHNQGRLENKQNSFDDFNACAEHLIAKKITSRPRLVCEGGSAGGLLTAGCVTQRPQDLFGAVIINKPVLDMINWQNVREPEFGHPGKFRKDFETALGYSPLHNLKTGAKYPPQLVIVGEHDDRVPEEQARRYVAVAQAETDPSNVVLLHVEKGTSHSGSADPGKNYGEIFAFIEKSIGPVNQEEHRLWQARKGAANDAAAQQRKRPDTRRFH